MAEHTIRAATVADAPAIAALINAVDAVDLGSAGRSVAETVADLAGLDDLATDSWLAFDGGGRLVCYAVLADSGGLRLDADHYVLLGWLAAGLDVLDRMLTRAGQVAADLGVPTVAVQLFLPPAATLTSTLPARGWQVVRRYHVLTRPLSPRTDTVPEPPAGVGVRTALDPADQRIAHRLLNTALADEWEHREREFDAWVSWLGGPAVDWSLVWIATLDGVDAAAVVGRRRGLMGWVRHLGTLAAARRRGLGCFLLRTAFAEFARRGYDTIGLGVDARNPTGAPRLYASVGLTLHYAVDSWEVAVPAP